MPKSPRDEDQPANVVTQADETKKVKVRGGETETLSQAESKLVHVYNLVEFKYIKDNGSGIDEIWADALPSVAQRFEKKIDALRAAVDANFAWYRYMIKSCQNEDREFGGDEGLIESIQPEKLVSRLDDDLGINVKSPKVEWERLQKLTVDQLEKLVAIQKDALTICLGENAFQYPKFVGSFWVEKAPVQGDLIKAESTLGKEDDRGTETPGEVLDKIARCVGERNVFHIVHQIEANSENWGHFATVSQEGREVYATEEAAQKSNVPAPHENDGINKAIMMKAFDNEPNEELSEFKTVSSKVEKVVVLFEYSREHVKVGPNTKRLPDTN